jgi:hypothetical protein
MKKIYLGNTQQGDEIRLDFEEEKIKFILLVGQSASGKSIFHNNLYKQLSENYTPDEIGFVFLDNNMLDFNGWKSDYIVKSVIGRPKEGIKALEDISNQISKKILFIHIEECGMVYEDRMAVESAFDKIKGLKDVYVVYSTSRIDIGAPLSQTPLDHRRYLADWMKKFINLTVVFRTPGRYESNFLIRSDMADNFRSTGERVLVFNGKQILCRPFTNKEAEVLSNFKIRLISHEQ